jgi:hypothetical protein
MTVTVNMKFDVTVVMLTSLFLKLLPINEAYHIECFILQQEWCNTA